MIPLAYQIVIAVVIDFLLGDPSSMPHPVKLIGNTALRLEPVLRKFPFNLKINGIIMVLLIISMTGMSAFAVIRIAGLIHPLAGDIISILLIYMSIAARDLGKHGNAVYRALVKDDMFAARSAVAMIVGRDTDKLDRDGVIRATVESVAESIVDGITSPLFFACLFGPVGAIVYRAANTLDSTFGYRNESYLHFGWASARLDDLANYIPARITVPVIALAAVFSGYPALRTLQIAWRDCRKHESPNAAFSEAAMAGALGVQLGGLNYYMGEPLRKPFIGDPIIPLETSHVGKAIKLIYLTTAIFSVFCFAFLFVAAGAI